MTFFASACVPIERVENKNKIKRVCERQSCCQTNFFAPVESGLARRRLPGIEHMLRVCIIALCIVKHVWRIRK